MPLKEKNLVEYVDYNPNKCLLTAPGEIAAEHEKILSKKFEGRISIYRSEPFFIEALPMGIDKAHSIEVLINHLGIPKENVFMLHSGDVLEVSEEQAKVAGRVPVGAILVDGLGVGDVGNVVLRDRQHLAEDGIMIVVMSLDRASGELVAGPDIVSRGFVYVKESDELIEEARRTVDDALQACLDKGITDWGKLKTTTKDVLSDYVWKKTKRRPMILPIIMEV